MEAVDFALLFVNVLSHQKTAMVTIRITRPIVLREQYFLNLKAVLECICVRAYAQSSVELEHWKWTHASPRTNQIVLRNQKMCLN